MGEEVWRESVLIEEIVFGEALLWPIGNFGGELSAVFCVVICVVVGEVGLVRGWVDFVVR